MRVAAEEAAALELQRARVAIELLSKLRGSWHAHALSAARVGDGGDGGGVVYSIGDGGADGGGDGARALVSKVIFMLFLACRKRDDSWIKE